MVLVSMEKETIPYTIVSNNYTLGVSISSSQAVVTAPLTNICYKNGSGRRGLILMSMEHIQQKVVSTDNYILK